MSPTPRYHGCDAGGRCLLYPFRKPLNMTETIEQPTATPSEELSLDATHPEDISPTALVANAHMPTESDVTHIRQRQGASIADVAARMTRQHRSKGKGSDLLLKLCDRVISEQTEKNDSLRWENLVSMHNQIGQYLANASLITHFIRNRTLMRCVGDKPRLERLVIALARDLVTIKKRTMANADAYPIKSGVVSDDQMIQAIGIYENYEAILLDLVDVVLPNYHEAMEIITLAERTVLDLEAAIKQEEADKKEAESSIIPDTTDSAVTQVCDTAPVVVAADLGRGLAQSATFYPGESLELPANTAQGECIGGFDSNVCPEETHLETIDGGDPLIQKYPRGENPCIIHYDDSAYVASDLCSIPTTLPAVDDTAFLGDPSTPSPQQ